jgi:hypothetical protein
MGELLRALGTGADFTYKDVTYKLPPQTPAMVAAFEAWLEERAFDALNRRRGRMSEDDFQAAQGALLASIASGVYNFGSTAARYALEKTKDGERYWLWLRLKGNAGMTRAIVDAMCDDELEEMRLKQAAARADVDPILPPKEGVETASPGTNS